MAEIFAPWRLGRLTVPNRLVRSATAEGLAAPDGAALPALAELLAGLAAGGVGLVVSGHCFVEPGGRAHPAQTGLHAAAMVEPLARVAAAVHGAGGRLAVQLAHAGGQTKASWLGAGRVPLGPSALTHPVIGEEVHELGREQIEGLPELFAAAALRAKEAGVDAVELHGAHGYLLNQFLSPAFNHRGDEYGGDLAHRARLVRLVARAVRGAVGPAYPVFVKLSSGEAMPGGLTLEEAVQVARWLAEDGLDAIEVSGGHAAAGPRQAPVRPVKGPATQGYFLAAARAVKSAVPVPVVVVGGFRRRNHVEEALEAVDAVALCRPLIREPGLPRAWREGGRADAACVSCTKCMSLALGGGGVACALLAQAGR